MDDGMDDRTDLGEASFLIPMSFNICNDSSMSLLLFLAAGVKMLLV
jgi:hypothetical protein